VANIVFSDCPVPCRRINYNIKYQFHQLNSIAKKLDQIKTFFFNALLNVLAFLVVTDSLMLKLTMKDEILSSQFASRKQFNNDVIIAITNLSTLVNFIKLRVSSKLGGVVKVDIYEVDTKIALKVDMFLLGL